MTGKLLGHNYKHIYVARAAGLPVDRVRAIDVAQFPIEHARSRGSIFIVAVSSLAVVAYGWLLAKHVHPTIPLVLQIYLGCKCTMVHQTYSALIVDIFPERPGKAAASNNITRCTLAAVAVAVLDPLVRVMRYGGVFTLLGLLDAVGCVLAVLALRRWGRTWRQRRSQRNQATVENRQAESHVLPQGSMNYRYELVKSSFWPSSHSSLSVEAPEVVFILIQCDSPTKPKPPPSSD